MTIPRRANVDPIYAIRVALVFLLHNSDFFDVLQETMLAYGEANAMVIVELGALPVGGCLEGDPRKYKIN